MLKKPPNGQKIEDATKITICMPSPDIVEEMK
jgi:hypothetical protein